MPHELLPTANSPAELVLEDHHWVEIWSDYLPTRGAAADDVLTGPLVDDRRDTETTWVAVDPSLTFFDRSDPPAINFAIGGDPFQIFRAIEDRATTAPGGEVSRLPRELITNAALRAAEALKAHIESSESSGDVGDRPHTELDW